MHQDLSFYPNHPYHARFSEATLLIRESLTYLDITNCMMWSKSTEHTGSNRIPLNSKTVIKNKATTNLKSNRSQTAKTEANNMNIKTNLCCNNIEVSTLNTSQHGMPPNTNIIKAIRNFQKLVLVLNSVINQEVDF
jgi:hypothetical protein